MRTFLLVFDPDRSSVSVPALVLDLGLGTEIYTFDDNVCFLRTHLDLREIVSALKERVFDTREFFLTEVNAGKQGGVLMPKLWDFIGADDQISSAA